MDIAERKRALSGIVDIGDWIMNITLEQYEEFEHDGVLILPGKLNNSDKQQIVVMELSKRYVDYCEIKNKPIEHVSLNISFSYADDGTKTIVHNDGLINKKTQ